MKKLNGGDRIEWDLLTNLDWKSHASHAKKKKKENKLKSKFQYDTVCNFWKKTYTEIQNRYNVSTNVNIVEAINTIKYGVRVADFIIFFWRI